MRATAAALLDRPRLAASRGFVQSRSRPLQLESFGCVAWSDLCAAIGEKKKTTQERAARRVRKALTKLSPGAPCGAISGRSDPGHRSWPARRREQALSKSPLTPSGGAEPLSASRAGRPLEPSRARPRRAVTGVSPSRNGRARSFRVARGRTKAPLRSFLRLPRARRSRRPSPPCFLPSPPSPPPVTWCTFSARFLPRVCSGASSAATHLEGGHALRPFSAAIERRALPATPTRAPRPIPDFSDGASARRRRVRTQRRPRAARLAPPLDFPISIPCCPLLDAPLR